MGDRMDARLAPVADLAHSDDMRHGLISTLILLIAPQTALAEPVIRFSGDASMGVTYDSSLNDTTDLYGRNRLDTTIHVPMDNGLSAGVNMRATGGVGQPVQWNAPMFYITTTGEPQRPPVRY
ncbi:hypothetical protein ATO6_04595 [Oceanicola sp. 22II-s10i]|nr:hypothetical protein ATO6_04595 [Oceanicola sp. 22II-s10i]